MARIKTFRGTIYYAVEGEVMIVCFDGKGVFLAQCSKMCLCLFTISYP